MTDDPKILKDLPPPEIKHFGKARVGQYAYVYKYPDDEPIQDEFGWVSDLEYFDEREGEVKLVRQRWMLVQEETIILPDPYPPEDEDEDEDDEKGEPDASEDQ